MFSPNEEKIIEIVGDKKMTIGSITEKLYRGQKAPVSAGTVVSNAVHRINSKCEYHKLKWFLNGCGVGRLGKTIWKDKMP